MGAFQEIKRLHRETTLGAKEGVAFRYFSRPLASTSLYFIKNTRITPNQVTIASLLVGMAGTVVHVGMLTYVGLVLGGALFMLAHVLDALDGQLARHRKAGSEVGMHFDFFIDELKAYLMFGALGVRLYRQASLPGEEHPWLYGHVETPHPDALLIWALCGMAALAVGISCTQFLKLASWKATFPPPRTPPGVVPKDPSPVQLFVALAEKGGKFVVDYPSYIILLCLLNVVEIYFVGYALVVMIYAARTLLGITRKLWKINPYDRAP